MDKRYMALGTSMLVLRLLEQESMYGYQIIRELEQQSRNVFQLQEGTLYPILHNLEEQGAVSSYRQTADSGRIRHYSHRKTFAGRKSQRVGNLSDRRQPGDGGCCLWIRIPPLPLLPTFLKK